MASAEHLATVRADYDDMAVAYTAFIGEAFAGAPLNHLMVQTFADLVRRAGGGPVADVGCGPGHVTSYLRDRGVDAFGVDLSPRLVAAAREDSLRAEPRPCARWPPAGVVPGAGRHRQDV